MLFTGCSDENPTEIGQRYRTPPSRTRKAHHEHHLLPRKEGVIRLMLHGVLRVVLTWAGGGCGWLAYRR